MLDSGSDRDIVTTELAEELGLELIAKTVTIQTVESNVTSTRQFANLRIESVDEFYGADIIDSLVGTLLTSENDQAPAKRGFANLPHAHGVTFEDHDARVEMILGVAHAETWVGAELRRGNPKHPSFLKTSFGWTAVGGWNKKDSNNIACYATQVDDDALRKDFQKIFNHDFAPVSEAEVGESIENQEAI